MLTFCDLNSCISHLMPFLKCIFRYVYIFKSIPALPDFKSTGKYKQSYILLWLMLIIVSNK